VVCSKLLQTKIPILAAGEKKYCILEKMRYPIANFIEYRSRLFIGVKNGKGSSKTTEKKKKAMKDRKNY
jgi:hypothetical protein